MTTNVNIELIKFCIWLDEPQLEFALNSSREWNSTTTVFDIRFATKANEVN